MMHAYMSPRVRLNVIGGIVLLSDAGSNYIDLILAILKKSPAPQVTST